MTPTRPEPWYDPDPRDPRDGDMLDVSTVPPEPVHPVDPVLIALEAVEAHRRPERPDPDHRGRGCAWLAIAGALAVFWTAVALIVGEWLL